MRPGGPRILALVPSGADSPQKDDLDTVVATGDNDDLDAETEVSARSSAQLSPRLDSDMSAASPTETVPALRSDLRLTRTASGYQIVEPSSGRAIAVNEFEISIIRMLDGRRRISDVLDNCRRLEIPINVESLTKLVLQLERDGLLGQGASTESTTWGARAEWQSSVRSLFQSGIRFLRAGKHAEAAGYFEALLQEDPDNVEARELLAMAQQATTQTSSAMLAPAAIPVAAPPTPMPSRSVATPLPAAQADPPVHPTYPTKPTSRFGPLAQIGVAVLASIAIAVSVFALIERRGAVENRTAHEERTEHANAPTAPPMPTAPVAAPIATPRPEPVAPVPSATTKATAEAPAPSTTVEPGEHDRVQPTATDASTSDKTDVQAEANKPVAEQPEPVRVVAPAGGEVQSYLRRARDVRKGDELFVIKRSGDPAKIEALSAKLSELTELAKHDPDIYEPFLKDARDKLAEAQRVYKTRVLAPKAGKASPLVKDGARVSAGAVLVEIE